MRLPIALPVCALALAATAAGCGDDDEGGASEGQPWANLRVAVRAEGPGGPARERLVVCPTRKDCGLRAEDLAPVPGETACAQIYGGPATATVRGTVGGERVIARFKLTDSCEIERWRRNAELLGQPPRAR